MPIMERRWQLAEALPQEAREKFPEIPPLTLQLLWSRGVRTQGEIDEFLNPDWSAHVPDPYLFRHMRQAVELVYDAISAQQKIAVFGDYDADGVTSAIILVETLQRLGAEALVYLPHREREGYGLNVEAVRYLADQGARLLITCDCGVANIAQVAVAHELGLKVIVTDHHQPQAELPKADAILHPSLPGETYPCKSLSGGGVAFKFVQGLLRYEGCPLPPHEREAHEKWLLDLVAISTIADMVPLTGESRTLTKFGLAVLRKTRRLGLQELVRAAGLNPARLNSHSVGFQLAPRINAAGRLDHANAAYALLTASDLGTAQELARSLNLTNTERQKLTDEMYRTCLERLGELPQGRYLAWAFESGWQLGMVGLVAGKLVQRYGRPAIVMCEQGERVAGSGRSISTFDLLAALTSGADLLTAYGGHKQAAGFSLPKVNLEEFLKRMEGVAASGLAGTDLTPVLTVDADVSFGDLSIALADEMMVLEPWGFKNPKPVFVSRGLAVAGLNPVGTEGKHLRLALSQGGTTRRFIWFNPEPFAFSLPTGARVAVAFEIGTNDWNGRHELELKVLDVKLL